MHSKDYERIYQWIEYNYNYHRDHNNDVHTDWDYAWYFMINAIADMRLVTGEEFLDLLDLVKRIDRRHHDD